jgi:hypothetical protein
MPSLYESGPRLTDDEWRTLVAGQPDEINEPSAPTVGNRVINKAIASINTSPRQEWSDELARRQRAAQAWRQPADDED